MIRRNKMKGIIPFKRKCVKAYLDACIRKWRRRKEEYIGEEMSNHYIDAFQSVRSSLFGELLPVEIKLKQMVMKEVRGDEVGKEFREFIREQDMEAMNILVKKVDKEMREMGKAGKKRAFVTDEEARALVLKLNVAKVPKDILEHWLEDKLNRKGNENG